MTYERKSISNVAREIRKQEQKEALVVHQKSKSIFTKVDGIDWGTLPLDALILICSMAGVHNLNYWKTISFPRSARMRPADWNMYIGYKKLGVVPMVINCPSKMLKDNDRGFTDEVNDYFKRKRKMKERYFRGANDLPYGFLMSLQREFKKDLHTNLLNVCSELWEKGFSAFHGRIQYQFREGYAGWDTGIMEQKGKSMTMFAPRPSKFKMKYAGNMSVSGYCRPRAMWKKRKIYSNGEESEYWYVAFGVNTGYMDLKKGKRYRTGGYIIRKIHNKKMKKYKKVSRVIEFGEIVMDNLLE